MYSFLCKIKSYIQPFERVLALKELQSLAQCEAKPLDKSKTPFYFKINTDTNLEILLNNLTYWESIGKDDFHPCLTRQVKREATVGLVRNGIKPDFLKNFLPFKHEVPLQNRRVLRYASHGIHEYRGKFFPQLVRSLLNISGANQNSVILDSMCGSGTTLVESILHGCAAIGVDYNPLSVLMSQAKCEILSVDPELLVSEFNAMKCDLLNRHQGGKGGVWFASLPQSSQEYLKKWFVPEVLSDIDVIFSRIDRIKNNSIRKFFILSLSNIIRKVSWQKVDDLRVRKDIRLDIDIDPISELIAEIKRSSGLILSFLYENKGKGLGHAQVLHGDGRTADKILSKMLGRFDCIVTSPPYATALPYLDTDRLSIYFLNLFARSEHRKYDLKMIGNREISNQTRNELLQKYQEHKKELPRSITKTIDSIYCLNQKNGAGFRRQNLPSLLSKYFFDMKNIFFTFKSLLRSGAPAFVVVGNNHTIAGGQRIEIETDNFLAELGESVGLVVEETIPMEMLISRDIFKKNASSSEKIICFKNAN